MSVEERVKKAEEKTNPTPTESQKKAGNYAKGKVTIDGFKVAIENPKGSERSGTDKKGNKWKIKMKNPYGYFVKSLGKDGDPVDVFIGNDFSHDVLYIIDQVDPETRAFDEHKVMLGFTTEEQAKKAYLNNFQKGWTGFGKITPVSKDKFRKWLYNGKLTKLPAYKIVKQMKAVNEKKDRVCRILLKGVVEEGETLNNLKNQVKTDFDTLVLEIRSPGGSVLEGMQIMQWLDALTGDGKEVITVVSANAYSIASMIMLIANKRYISKHGEVMVHDPMIPKIEYANANQLESQVEELRKLESVLHELYKIFTGLDDDTIKGLMNKETYLKPEDAVRLGFADEVIEIEPQEFEMGEIETKNKIENMSKTLNVLNKVIAMVNGNDYVNQTYGTLEGEELEIYQADPSQYSVGDRTDKEEGTFTLSDGAKVVVEGNEIKDIQKAVEPPQDDPENPESKEHTGEEEMKEHGDEMKPEDAKPGEVNEPETPTKLEAGEFNTGPAPGPKKEEMEGYQEPMSQEQVPPETPAPTPTPETVPGQTPPSTEAPASEQQKNEEMVNTVKEMQKTIDSLQKKVSELTTEKLEKNITEMSAQMQKFENKLEDFGKFEEVATEAIDTLAQNTSSAFKPQAKATAKPQPKGSIFQQALERKRAASQK